MTLFDKPLFIFEMANNHQGEVEHGKKIIRAMAAVSTPYREQFNFAIKFQYRDLDTFIRPDYKERDDVKNIKRFKETRLSQEEFLELKREAESCNFFTICTPFDELSAQRIAAQKYDAIKIASCSFTDWSLIETIATTKLPVIASTAAATLEDIDKIVQFFNHRNIPLALMHCVAEYPTPASRLELNQISLLQQRYPDLRIGFSTHEEPSEMDSIKIAVAKGAKIFERHVGVVTDKISLNKYSSTPDEISSWLTAAKKAFDICGVSNERYTPSQKEINDLAALQRGVFASKDLVAGTDLNFGNTYFAFPCEAGQVLAKHMSKYAKLTLQKSVEINKPIPVEDVNISDGMRRVQEIVHKLMDILRKGHIVIPVDSSCNISHHYGIDRYEEVGVTLIDCVNRAYCKKLLILLPGQKHPTHFHKKKEETFTVLYGVLNVVCDGKAITLKQGESMTVSQNMKHSFSSETGCIFEELSTTHYKDDSYYDDMSEFANPRKTKVYLTNDMLRD